MGSFGPFNFGSVRIPGEPRQQSLLIGQTPIFAKKSPWTEAKHRNLGSQERRPVLTIEAHTTCVPLTRDYMARRLGESWPFEGDGLR